MSAKTQTQLVPGPIFPANQAVVPADATATQVSAPIDVRSCNFISLTAVVTSGSDTDGVFLVEGSDDIPVGGQNSSNWVPTNWFTLKDQDGNDMTATLSSSGTQVSNLFTNALACAFVQASWTPGMSPPVSTVVITSTTKDS